MAFFLFFFFLAILEHRAALIVKKEVKGAFRKKNAEAFPLLSSLRFPSALLFYLSDGYTYDRHDRIYLVSFSSGTCARRVVKLARRCFSVRPQSTALLPFYVFSISACVSFSSVTLIPPLIESFLVRPISR